ncbi:MAG TPA: sigma-70 region 4 domain-containing protein [Gammaproteobacteria bacterium]|nr:sigma-70 region 4 domain-containing protein [Gammaproteobacteria bacterium]
MSADPADERERVRRAAAALSPLERDVLTLSAGLGLSNGDIAVRLGISERRAERLLARAVSRVDRALERPSQPWWRIW